MIYLEQQLSLIRHLQEWCGPLFDPLLRILNQMDTFSYYSGLISFIWVGISWRWGVRLGFLLIVNGIVNTLVKLAFALPRPYCFDPLLAVVEVGGYGFPSGGAQTAMVFAVLLAYYWKSRWSWPLAFFYLFSISFSRVALGVHFPVDVFGGWSLGLIVASGFLFAVRPVESFAARHPQAMLAFFAAPALLAAFISAKLSFLMAIAVASALGVFFSTKYRLYIVEHRTWWRKCLHGVVAIAGAALFGYLAKELLHEAPNEYLVEGIAGALWVSLLASPFCKRTI